MKSQSVDIMCIQEVRKKNSDKFISDDGYTVLWSGSGDGSREWAGVGFIISPSLQRNFLGFRPLSNRIAALKLSVNCRSLVVFSVYAPHNLKPLPERVSFYDDLDKAVQVVKANGPTYIVGDLNARLGQRRTGEEDILGDYCFGREAQHAVEAPNRELLIEFCTSLEYIVANTWMPNPWEMQVTYHEPSVHPR
jgi:exonuclease III